LISNSDVELEAIPAQTQRLNLDNQWPSESPSDNPVRAITPDHLAYLIYTSGSTGAPKGVLIPHRGLVNLTEDKIRVCDVRPNDCVLQFFSFSFDASIPEIIMSLAVGAKLLLSTPEILLPGPPLAQLLKRQKVTHITITPSALLSVPQDDFPDLRMVLVGGEAPSQELINTWGKGRRFINAYGPTETTVNASMVALTEASQAVLRPSTNKQLYVLDEQLQLLPVGLVGELHIAGVGLARGYLNRPDLTCEKFIPNPFGKSESKDYPQDLLYKTGDLASIEKNGDIRILGRIDNQTKIRGFRIEPGEVETVLNQNPQVKTSLVVVREDTPGDKRLVAYLIGNEGTAAAPTSELRQFVSETLPHYMVPAGFVWLQQYPLTPNGKVDLKALPQPEQQKTERVDPRSSSETTLFSIFKQVLNEDTIGIHDDFFEVGGHSLLATQLVAQCLNKFDVELTVIDLFEAPSVAELAQRIEQKQLLTQLQASPVEDDDSEREEFAL
ncbi:MAG: non-ribosomal peptide synthetase, partial [Cyanobacteria bacterium P01_F01_bin.42]